MQHRNAGLIADPLFIGATRPSMLWGVTYSAVMLNAMCIMELFLLTKNLLILLLACEPACNIDQVRGEIGVQY